VERLLRNEGVTVNRQSDTSILHLPDGEAVADLVRDAIADAGARLQRMEHRRRSLEDLIVDSST